MKKIVVNACYGGFSLSHEAMLRYCEIKGLPVWPEQDEHGYWCYWLVPETDRIVMPEHEAWAALPDEERQELDRRYDAQTLGCRDFERDDPVLVRVVEEFAARGGHAGGDCAKLRITEIPGDVGDNWEISEYDGLEHVAEKHRTW